MAESINFRVLAAPNTYFLGQRQTMDRYSQEQQELPKWALRMKPNEGTSILEVPSNANRKNGMIRSASVTIVNDERTWEQFHAKIVCTHADKE